MEAIREAWVTEGPFDGVLGFSNGAAAGESFALRRRPGKVVCLLRPRAASIHRHHMFWLLQGLFSPPQPRFRPSNR